MSDTNVDRVFRGLRHKILTCEIQPAAKIRIADVCDEFSVSLGPAREALSRLAAGGMVTAEPQRGFSVTPMSRIELEHMSATRIEIEFLCLDQAIKHGDLNWESEIIAAEYVLRGLPMAVERHLDQRWAAAHSRFHSALVAACPNKWLLRIREMLYMHTERYRHWLITLRINRSARNIVGEHSHLREVVLARDQMQIRRAIETHFAVAESELTQIAALLEAPSGSGLSG